MLIDYCFLLREPNKTVFNNFIFSFNFNAIKASQPAVDRLLVFI